VLEHGGKLHEATARFGEPADGWLDLSTGLNPHGYPAPVLAADAWHRLPETDPELVRAASAYYGAPPMLAVAGTQAAIQALPRMRSPSRVVVAAPSYAEHAYHWSRHGHRTMEVAYEALAAALAACEVMVLCNPNNPTGATVPPDALLDWASQLASRGGWLVVDEAFADTVPDLSVAGHSAQPGLIVLRSLGKFFGLAGVRVGFVGAEMAVLAQLEALLGPWTVSGPAQQLARAALRDLDWQTRMRTRLDEEGRRLQSLLAAHGIASQGTALFQWCPQVEPDHLWRHMAERGIWVRLFPDAAKGVRLGLPPDERGWRRLACALEEWTTHR
jgi:cobalamin biosynthetic protein CobC